MLPLAYQLRSYYTMLRISRFFTWTTAITEQFPYELWRQNAGPLDMLRGLFLY
jgi:hypothetical protein